MILLGAIQKVCHRPRGRGSSKIVTNSDKGGKGIKPKSNVTAYEKILWQFSKLLIFCEKYQLPNCILFELIFV